MDTKIKPHVIFVDDQGHSCHLRDNQIFDHGHYCHVEIQWSIVELLVCLVPSLIHMRMIARVPSAKRSSRFKINYQRAIN